jgi:hypothetical protein
MPITVQSAEMPSSSDELDRAFYFIVVLWGERFRDYFLEYCLPSLLSAGNIPSLNTAARSKFLIATRPEDWSVMVGTPIFDVLKRYVDPVYIEIPPCPPHRSGCEHMNTGHKLACEMAFREKARALVLTPDCMLSDGSVVRLQELAHDGVELVVAAALRFGEEPFLEHLKTIGVLKEKCNSPLSVTGRQMVAAAMNGLHPETLSYEWDAPYLVPKMPAAWWRVPGEGGIVLHCLSWAPLLLDYGAVAKHDTSTLESWTIDGDYLFRNVSGSCKVHVVQDSDEIFLASWGPMADRAAVVEPLDVSRRPVLRRLQKWLKIHQFCASFYGSSFDQLKRDMFFKPVRWHSRALNEKWSVVEQNALASLTPWISPRASDRALDRNGVRRPHPRIGWIMNCVVELIAFRRQIFHRIKQASTGDSAALHRIVWHIKRELFLVLGIRYNVPAPPPPKFNK